MTERYVTDSHALIWYLAGSPKLSQAAKMALDRTVAGAATLVIPAIALAEILWIAGKRRIGLDSEKLWFALAAQSTWAIAPLDELRLRAMAEMVSISEMHDRMIACEAKIQGAVLITRDADITIANVVATLW